MNFSSHCGNPVNLKIPDGDNRERHVCGHCDIIHYQNPRIIAGCIPVLDDQVLLCKRAIEPRFGLWTLPAGFMENGETTLQGALRECEEEANARIDNPVLSGIFDIPYINQVYMFYRGNWCPLCMAQIGEIAAQYKALCNGGVNVALISPQPHRYTVDLAAKHEVYFDFLTDKGNRSARALGIVSRFGTPMGFQLLGYASETVLPTVIITDKDGVVQWTDETDNYRVRPEPDTFITVMRDKGLIPA